MTLDNIMKMAKADRYTDEGKKEIQDAKRYKAGEISEATGLQKQTDGSWAPPKSGKGQTKGAGSEEIGKFYTKFDVQGAYDAGRQTFPEGGYTIFKTPEGQYKVVDDPKTKQRMQDAGYEVEVDVPEGTKPPKSPAAGSEGSESEKTKTPKSSTLKKEVQNKLAEVAKISGNYKPENLYAQVTPKGNIAIIEKKPNGITHNIITVGPRSYHLRLEELDEAGLLDRPNYDDDTEDAEYTPESINEPREKLERQLTGDTRLRLSQVQDRVYKIGEISQKTGMMKTEHGWVKPPKNGGKAAGSEKTAENKSMNYKENFLNELRTGNHNVKEWAYNKEFELGEEQEKLLKKQSKAKTPEEKKKIENQMAEIGKQIDALGEATKEYNNNPDGEEKKYQDRKKAQQVEAARQNKNYRDFYDNTGLKGRGGPEEALARNEADKEDRKQDNLKAGKRDDSMFQKNDKIEFNRAGHYINGSIEKVDKDWQGNVSLYVRGEDGKGYWVETNNVTKHEGAN